MATIIVGSARSDENGKASGGKVGDQKKGAEVSTQVYYTHSKGWYGLRAKSAVYGEAIAAKMKAACDNNHLGYDQSNRLGVIKYGVNTTTNTECDCSSLVRACVKEATGTDPGNFTTANEKSMLLATGLFTDLGSITKASQVENGDILVTKTKGHTVIVVSGNPRTVAYYPKYTGSSGSIVAALKSLGVDSSYSHRAKIAAANNITSYKGSESQNIKMLKLLKSGKLIKE